MGIVVFFVLDDFLGQLFLFWPSFLDNQVNELEDNKEYYKEEIKKDEQQIKQLKKSRTNTREKYYMKRKMRIFIL
jgi:hypothetical protein